MPAEVRKTKQKSRVEGSVGKIARKIIRMLRNETFHSLEALNHGIRETLAKLNSKEFQRRNGSRKVIFETEEKPMLRPLPLMPFEICEWFYNHKVGPNSHIWFDKGQYCVPSDYLNRYVDIRYNNKAVYIYSSHKRIPSGIKNGKRTEPSHLPYPQYIPEPLESTTAKAEKIGANAKTVVLGIYESAKIKEQALMDARAVLDIAVIYGEEMLEEACQRALRDFHAVTYNILIPYIKEISKDRRNKGKPGETKKQEHGI